MKHFGEDFGQKVDLTASIRGILRNYPEGTAVFKELIQNADDAGARSISLCLDCRHHGAAKLADAALAQFQGPSLLVYNDAMFTKEDFQSIQRIGDSLKNQTESSKTKIGRFGIGFNAVYHWTELPTFISDRFLVMLDPQARFLPNVNPANPGKIVDWLGNTSVLTDFSDQFSPFAIPGIDWSHRFEGTLFRLPLRTEEQASSSLLSKRSLTTKQVEDILVSLAHEATSMLLFLRSIEKITIQIWNNDSSEPSVLFSCGIANVDSSLRNQRSFDVALGKQRSQAIAAQSKIIQDCVLQIEVIDNINGHSSRETWNVCNQFGGDEASKLVAHPTNSHLKLVPVGGVAVKLSDIDEDAASRDGFAYCFLPLPVRTGLPVMINGFFELSSNRRDIWQESSDMTGDGSLRARWNVALLRDVIAPCYARLICSLRDKLGFSLFYQSLWPKWDLPLPWCYLGNSTLQELATKPLLKLDASPSGAPIWIESTNAVVLPTHLSADEKKELSVILKHLGSHVVTFSDDELHRSLIVANITKNIAIPSFFRSVIKQSSTVMIPSMCKASLAYCLSDQHTSSLSMEMDGLRLLPMKDGTVGRLRVLSSAHKASVDALISMGFSVQSALGSLLRHNFDVDRSWEFLTLPTSVNGIAWRNEGLCILPSPQDNLEIFEKAYHIIIDQHAIGANELEFLSSSEQMQFTNIRHFEFAHIPDLLLYVFPPIFSDKMPVVVDSLDSNIRQYLLAYLPRFWKYLESHPKAITALYENIPVLPTNDFMEICPISRLSNVISSRKGDAVLSAEVLIIVRSLGVRTLDVTAGDLNAFPPSLWDYIFSPNSPGILGALEFSYRNLSDVDSRLQRLSSSERDHLRGVLIEKQGSVLSSQNRDVLNRLPVWKLAKSKSLGEGDTPYTALSAVSPAIVIADSAAFPSVVLPSHAIDCESEKAWNLLKQLQVQRITKSEFLQRYFFPNVVAFHKKHKSEVESFLLTIFLDFRAISLQDRSFGDFLKTVPCILNAAGEMKMIGDLYDPSEREILELMGDIMLPDVNFRQEEILVTLKHLGLRTAIDLSSLLQCARAVEAINDETQGDVKLAKARALLKYLDHNLAKLFGEDTSKKSAGGMGFFSNISSLFVDKTANKAEISLFKSELKRIAWLPVMIAPPVAYIPWVQGQPTLCAPPEHCASVKDMWYCSATSRIMEERISSQTLISTLGIDQPVSIETLAIQLREIALSFKANKQNNVEPAIQDNFRMQIAEIIGHVYAQFDQATESDRSIIYRQLESAPWIWVGSDFVTVFKVARHCSVNAAPFLYQLPASMRSYQKLLEGFRVKDHFHAHDYIDALHELAVMYPDSILEDSMLEISISLVILLGSESTSILRSSEIFVPDINGRLAPAADLVNDDVPWLAGQEFLSLRASCRMVHPKISSSVAEKVGVKSLRLSLVKRNLEQNLFGTTLASGGNIESFGQAESLTNRLKTILDLYPDGSPILNELIQNADDSKATVVRIMIDENHYRSESLMDNRMEAIQGPALVVQNDSEFSEADFRNLASVGQGSKLEKLATTGRFGLGFNSTYHITDTPTFVSGEHFVFFDPHCAFVPGATMNQPGMRIRYTKSDLNVAFADQFAPYKFYGFDFSTPYRGTMFRFPLRGFSQAKRSEICKRAYQVSDVYAMIEQIGQQLTEVLMFLRSVKRIELYRCPAGSNEPILISSASSEVTDLKQMHDQDLISFFDAQSSQQMTKDQFYAKLMNIPDDKLPWTSCTKKFEVDYFTYQPEQSLLSRVKSDISSYKIIYGLCGGSAKRLACREEARHLKLIPFGSVSACIQRQQKNIADDTADNSHLIPPISGQLFCFLPLPIRTSLPVHVNAYWELSSNRRDIWRGDDTKGEAKLRSGKPIARQYFPLFECSNRAD